MDWHYADHGNKVGPVPDAELLRLVQAGTINETTLVWHPGMPDWLPYRQVRDHANRPAVPPPPIALNPAGEREVVCAECHKMFPVSATTRFGKACVCMACKPVFLSKLTKGVPLHDVDVQDVHYAGFWIRCLALILDRLVLLPVIAGVYWIGYLLLSVPILTLATAAHAGQTPADGKVAMAVTELLLAYILIMAFIVVLMVAYETILVGKYGATLGKMACQLRVVNANGSEIGYARAFARCFALVLSSLTCNIGFLIAAFDGEKRALHDYICCTRVIYK